MNGTFVTRLGVSTLAVSLAACATPNLEYSARVPAGATVVAEYQTVAVDRFRGPEAGWYTGVFERMVADAEFDGAPWFRLASSYDDPEAVFRGYVEIDWVDEDHDRNIVSRCVEWDGPFDCETRRDVVEHCIRLQVQLTAEPELLDRETGRVVWRGRYPGSASGEACNDVGYADEVGAGPWDAAPKRHHGSRAPFGGYGGFSMGGNLVDQLVREALSETLEPIRADIAPRNVTARAHLIKEATDPVVRADPRFNLALKAAEDNNISASCSLWKDLAAAYPDEAAVKFNTGACLEASGNYSEAHKVYLEVSRMPVELPGRVREALDQIESRRLGEAEIERLMAQPEPTAPKS